MSFHGITLVLVASVYCTVAVCAENETLYDSYTDLPVTEEQVEIYQAAGITDTCTNPVALPCDPNEWRRLDGSCNNLNYVSRGMYCTPQVRLLEADYNIENGTYNPRLKKSGQQLDLVRVIRQTELSVGTAVDSNFTQVLPYLFEYFFGDYGSGHDTQYFVFKKTYCCEEEGKTDFMCIPNTIPQNDSVHQFSGIRCMNHTRPLAFQNMGCLGSDTTPDRVDFTTVHFDLSMIYYYAEGVTPSIRTYSSGLLKTETVDGQDYPSDANETTTCFIEDAIETGCTRNVPNGLLGTNIFVTLFWRNHNYIAKKLATINPGWTDETLFQVARDINIAMYLQIIYREMFPLLFGKENMEAADIVCSGDGFCDRYDSTIPPQMTLESSYICRFMHTIQDGTQKMYDENDVYVGKIAIGNFTLKVQELAVDKKMSKIVHGMYLQPCGGFDHIVHPELADKGLGPWQKAFDIPMADLNKGRYFGFPGYIEYLAYFTNETYTSFEDLSDFIEPERLDLLREHYEHPSDIELLAGAWSEKPMPGGRLPSTVTWLLMRLLKLNVMTDRHWYERADRPHAFTSDQLGEIRKCTIAMLLCNVGDNVSQIQPQAFLRKGDGNEMVDCSEISNIDFSKWEDTSSSSDGDE